MKFNSALIINNMRLFIKNITKETIQKANLSETLLMTEQPYYFAQH